MLSTNTKTKRLRSVRKYTVNQKLKTMKNGAKSKTARKTCVKKFCNDYMLKKTAQNWENIIANLENKPHKTPQDTEDLALYKSPGFVKDAVATDAAMCPDWFCNPGCKGLSYMKINKSGFGDKLNRRDLVKRGSISGCTNAPILDVKLSD